MEEKHYYTYQPSVVFESLKKVSETIQHNYSTEQYLNALDTMLGHAIRAIVKSSNYVDKCIAEIAASSIEHTSTKVCTYGGKEGLKYLLIFLTRAEPDDKMVLFRRMRLDRNLTLRIIDEWLAHLVNYRQDIESGNIHGVQRAKQEVLANTCLYAPYAEVLFWCKQAKSLRQFILEKYYRLVLNEARSFYMLMRQSVSLDDTIQSMFIEATKALDKCNPERGALTSYVQRWVRLSRSSLSTELDVAYDVPAKQSRQDFSYKSAVLDETDEDVGLYDDTVVRLHVQKIARIMDPSGLGRKSLDISEYIPALTVS